MIEQHKMWFVHCVCPYNGISFHLVEALTCPKHKHKRTAILPLGR